MNSYALLKGWDIYGKHSCIGRIYAIQKAELGFAQAHQQVLVRSGKGVEIIIRPPSHASVSVNAQLATNARYLFKKSSI